MSKLELRDVVAGFENGGELGPINLSVKKGAMLALLGASGSGKTTTLRLIAGLHEPLSGDILFSDHSLLTLSSKKRKVGMVFQNFGLFPHMTVENNINFGLRMKKAGNSEISKRTKDMIAAMKLGGLEGRFPHQLSGGQQQRVALARTLILDPDILLLDEPLSNLDANLRKETAAFISNLQREFGITTVFVTHDQEEALLLADEVAVIDQGAVLQVASPREISEKPNCLSVAKFMGVENLIPVLGKSEFGFETPIGEVQLQNGQSNLSNIPKFLMVRSEQIVLSDISEDATQTLMNSYVGEISDARYLSGFMTYKIRVNNEVLTARSAKDRIFKTGQRVGVMLNPETLWPIEDER
ncbi:ABC transporter ATP-binding protein [Sneathiella limimaris]|uniref:ABC transporter ATP-binding protein n=1 Tax=Sneathiella limimaris TaxID=1964213 RepID=UPI00146F6F2D|nr:ABC transporter ATP-binding protein [Sneathiella limimaris]